MIKYFRRIRQKLLTKNSPEHSGSVRQPDKAILAGAGKFSKYLTYALGEIVLVVIGILIALQINNLNERRKAFNSELQIYGNLIHDLNDEYTTTLSNINWMYSSQNLHFYLYNESIGKVPFDSTKSYDNLQWVFPYHISITDKHTESLNKISNSDIREILKAYMEQEKDTKDAYDEWNELKEKRLRPFFNKHGIHNTDGAFEETDFDFYGFVNKISIINNNRLKKQFQTTELNELLFDLRFKTSWAISQLQGLKRVNNNLEKALIDQLVLHKKSKYFNRVARIEIVDLLAEEKSIDEIIELLKNDDKNQPIYIISEYNINASGYQLMYEERNEDALKLFEVNTKLYPKSSNAFDSYGEGLIKIGDKKKAIWAYNKSLELNPNNENAKTAIKKIE